MSHRLFLSMPDELYEKFENTREQLGMNRSMYVRYLMAGQKELRPPTMRYLKLIDRVGEIEHNVKIIACKPDVTDIEKLALMEQLTEINKLLEKNYGSGQIVKE